MKQIYKKRSSKHMIARLPHIINKQEQNQKGFISPLLPLNLASTKLLFTFSWNHFWSFERRSYNYVLSIEHNHWPGWVGCSHKPWRKDLKIQIFHFFFLFKIKTMGYFFISDKKKKLWQGLFYDDILSPISFVMRNTNKIFTIYWHNILLVLSSFMQFQLESLKKK